MAQLLQKAGFDVPSDLQKEGGYEVPVINGGSVYVKLLKRHQGGGGFNPLMFSPAALLYDKVEGKGESDNNSIFEGSTKQSAVEQASKILHEYEGSIASQLKNSVVKNLAEVLGIPASANSADAIKDIVEKATIQLPKIENVMSRNVKKDDAAAKACYVIANGLNKTFTPGVTDPREKFIDDTQTPNEVCRQTLEWMNSFRSGVNTEFLAVHASVKNSLRSLQILQEMMKHLAKEIKTKARQTGDTKYLAEVNTFEEA